MLAVEKKSMNLKYTVWTCFGLIFTFQVISPIPPKCFENQFHYHWFITVQIKTADPKDTVLWNLWTARAVNLGNLTLQRLTEVLSLPNGGWGGGINVNCFATWKASFDSGTQRCFFVFVFHFLVAVTKQVNQSLFTYTNKKYELIQCKYAGKKKN